MKTNSFYSKCGRLILLLILILSISWTSDIRKKLLTFRNYPNLKIGFSTQNFQAAMANNVKNLTELIEYASKEGYQFIELRDDLAKLTKEECEILSAVAEKNKIEVIYEIQVNPLSMEFSNVFQKGLNNTIIFHGPGIIRALISKSEFDADKGKKGWNYNELSKLVRVSDSCALVAKAKNITFAVENFNEPFFGDSINYYGLNDFFTASKFVGLQFDISNPFRNSSREKSDPGKVIEYLPSLGNRWVTTHLKTNLNGEAQPVLTENPLPISTVIRIAGRQNAEYVAIEIVPVNDKQKCFENHAKSINYLKALKILK